MGRQCGDDNYLIGCIGFKEIGNQKSGDQLLGLKFQKAKLNPEGHILRNKKRCQFLASL